MPAQLGMRGPKLGLNQKTAAQDPSTWVGIAGWRAHCRGTATSSGRLNRISYSETPPTNSRARSPARRSLPDPASVPITCGYHWPPLEDPLRRRPCRRVVERVGAGDVDAFLGELAVPRPIEQHHVLLQERVPVHRRSPEPIDVARVKRTVSREDWLGRLVGEVLRRRSEPDTARCRRSTRRRARPARRDRSTGRGRPRRLVPRCHVDRR